MSRPGHRSLPKPPRQTPGGKRAPPTNRGAQQRIGVSQGAVVKDSRLHSHTSPRSHARSHSRSWAQVLTGVSATTSSWDGEPGHGPLTQHPVLSTPSPPLRPPTPGPIPLPEPLVQAPSRVGRPHIHTQAPDPQLVRLPPGKWQQGGGCSLLLASALPSQEVREGCRGFSSAPLPARLALFQPGELLTLLTAAFSPSPGSRLLTPLNLWLPHILWVFHFLSAGVLLHGYLISPTQACDFHPLPFDELAWQQHMPLLIARH